MSQSSGHALKSNCGKFCERRERGEPMLHTAWWASRREGQIWTSGFFWSGSCEVVVVVGEERREGKALSAVCRVRVMGEMRMRSGVKGRVICCVAMWPASVRGGSR